MGGASKLILRTGAVLKGAVIGSTVSGASNTLVLQGSGKLFNRFQNFNELAAQGSGAWTLDGDGTFGSATVGAGTLRVGDAGHKTARIVIDGPAANQGLIDVGGGVLNITGAVTGSGSVEISGGTLRLASSFNENVAFTGAGGVLQLAKSPTYHGTISGFAAGDKLNLASILFASGATTATFTDDGSHAGGVLTVSNGSQTARITLAGDYTGATFTIGKGSNGGTTVVEAGAGGAPAAADALVGAMAALGGGGVDRWAPGHASDTAASPLLRLFHGGGRASG
jgi:hypothetical protein